MKSNETPRSQSIQKAVSAHQRIEISEAVKEKVSAQRYKDAVRRWKAVERLTQSMIVSAVGGSVARFHTPSLHLSLVTKCREIASSCLDYRGDLIGAPPRPERE